MYNVSIFFTIILFIFKSFIYLFFIIYLFIYLFCIYSATLITLISTGQFLTKFFFFFYIISAVYKSLLVFIVQVYSRFPWAVLINKFKFTQDISLCHWHLLELNLTFTNTPFTICRKILLSWMKNYNV